MGSADGTCCGCCSLKVPPSMGGGKAKVAVVETWTVVTGIFELIGLIAFVSILALRWMAEKGVLKELQGVGSENPITKYGEIAFYVGVGIAVLLLLAIILLFVGVSQGKGGFLWPHLIIQILFILLLLVIFILMVVSATTKKPVVEFKNGTEPKEWVKMTKTERAKHNETIDLGGKKINTFDTLLVVFSVLFIICEIWSFFVVNMCRKFLRG